MATKFTDLTTKTTAAATDLVPINDVSAAADKKVTVAGLAAAVGANLPSSLFSGLVNSFTNASSAGGTYWYVNLFGIKMLWGQTTGGLAGGTAAPDYILTLPAFFTTIQSATATLNGLATTPQQSAYVIITSTTQLDIKIWAATSTTGEAVGIFVIGT